MYADDIILLSSSANGLPEKLDILSKYCKDWCLNVNTLKTKIMIFNKAGKFHNIDLNLNGMRFECVSRYKYLGVYFCLIWLFPYLIYGDIPYQPSTNIIPRAKALGMILVSQVDTGCDTIDKCNKKNGCY
jgi:hypothetical protein